MFSIMSLKGQLKQRNKNVAEYQSMKDKSFLFFQPLPPLKLTCLVWIRVNEAWKSLHCERCTVNMKRLCPSSVDVSCKFQNQISPPSTLEQMGKSQMTAHHRYSEQVLLEAQLLKMVLGWHSQRKETENIKKKKKKNSRKQIQNNFSWEIRRNLLLLLLLRN